jgi:phage baseplate assembly protein W
VTDATSDHLGRDLMLTPFFAATEWDALDLVARPAGQPYPDEPVDLGTARGEEALRQAMILRLLTPVGALAELGHAEYGSRLGELVGLENTETNRLRARAFVLQALAQEGRVEEVLDLRVGVPSNGAGDRISVSFRVRPTGGGDPVTLGLELGL